MRIIKNGIIAPVRAILDIIDFKDDYKQLTGKLFPPITLKQARDSIALLKKLGIIAFNDKGFLKPTNKVIVTGEFIKDDIVKQFQMKCFGSMQETYSPMTA